MIQVTLTFNSIAAAVAALSKIPEADAAFAKTAAVSADEKTAVLLATETALADTVEAPGKPSAAPTARSQRTAAAAPSPSAQQAAAPATQTTATQPSADASSASGGDAFDYATLQKAVNAAVPKHGKENLLAIAKAHGADNFKGLDASKWAAAHADVVALG